MMPMVRAPPLPSHVLAPLSAELRLELDMQGARAGGARGGGAAVSALEPPRVVAELRVLSEAALTLTLTRTRTLTLTLTLTLPLTLPLPLPLTLSR